MNDEPAKGEPKKKPKPRKAPPISGEAAEIAGMYELPDPMGGKPKAATKV